MLLGFGSTTTLSADSSKRLAAKFSLDPLIQRHKPSPLSENYRRKGYPPALEKNARQLKVCQSQQSVSSSPSPPASTRSFTTGRWSRSKTKPVRLPRRSCARAAGRFFHWPFSGRRQNGVGRKHDSAFPSPGCTAHFVSKAAAV